MIFVFFIGYYLFLLSHCKDKHLFLICKFFLQKIKKILFIFFGGCSHGDNIYKKEHPPANTKNL